MTKVSELQRQDFEVGDPLGQWDGAPSDWSRSTLWELAEYINGRAFKPADFSPEGLQIIKITELKYGVSRNTARFAGDCQEKHILQNDELLFAWSGNPETSLDAFWWRDGKALLNQHIFRVIPRKGIDKRYLFFLFKFLRRMFIRTARDKATSMGHVKVSDLKRLIAYVPPLDKQISVGQVLGALDDKIELNRRMNETLEVMARAIFKSWFVDFDPVRAKTEGREPYGMDADTAALFPDSFQDSSLGKFPKGWRVGCIGDIAENLRRQVNPEDVPEDTSYIGLEHMPRKTIVLANWGRSEKVTSNKFRFRAGEILFGKLRPYFHKVGEAVTGGVCSTDVLVTQARAPEWYGLVLGHLSSEKFVNYTDAVSTGTKMPRTNWTDMARYEICLPDAQLASLFGDQTTVSVEKIRQNVLQSRTLAAIRDTLLPKLISGEIRVKTAEEYLEAKV